MAKKLGGVLLMVLVSLTGRGKKKPADPPSAITNASQAASNDSGVYKPSSVNYVPPENEDGSADCLFTPEQFEIFKKDTYDTGCYEYGAGRFPQSVKTVEYTKIDGEGIPWASVVSIKQEKI